MKRFAIIFSIIAIIVALVILVVTIDQAVSTGHQNQNKSTTVLVKDTAFTYASPQVIPTTGYSPKCSQRVHRAGKAHHIATRQIKAIDGTACHWRIRPGKISTVQVKPKGNAVYEGPLYRSTEHPQVCGITCGLWQATLAITWEHDNTWAGKVHASCTNYSGLMADFAVQQCVVLKPGDAVVSWARPYVIAQEQFELKITVVWFTSSEHYSQSEHLYPSGKVTYQHSGGGL